MSDDRDRPLIEDATPRDPWTILRRATRARIGLGRSGNAIPMDEVLRFQAAHAMARDAVHAMLDVAALERDLARHGAPAGAG